MDTESQDQLSAFCEAYILQHREKWPTSEDELAKAFVLRFGIPIIFRIADLQNFLVQTNIELVERDLPVDLLGANMSFGIKRQIFTSNNPDYVPFRVHTVLHEIREIIEVEFRRLGFRTTNSSGLDSRADDFAFEVHMCTGMDSIKEFFKYGRETTSTWGQFASLCFIIAIYFLFGLRSFFGAFGYHSQDPIGRRPVRSTSK
jgi:hypothetical protein